MFFVFNKRKIGSYLISIGTVAILFSVALFGGNGHFGDGEKNVIATSASNINNLPIYKVETETKKVSLSINCGENVENIDNILNTLSKTNAKATFFISGKIASSNAETIKKIVQSGNEVGNLSYNYTNLKKKKTEEIKDEITKASNEIEKITGQNVKIFRAPYGECSNEIIKIASEQGLSTVQWNVDSLDYNGLNGEEMCDRINENLSPGSIILLHNSAKYTSESIEKIIQNIQKQGYQLVTTSELLALQNQDKSKSD